MDLRSLALASPPPYAAEVRATRAPNGRTVLTLHAPDGTIPMVTKAKKSPEDDGAVPMYRRDIGPVDLPEGPVCRVREPLFADYDPIRRRFGSVDPATLALGAAQIEAGIRLLIRVDGAPLFQAADAAALAQSPTAGLGAALCGAAFAVWSSANAAGNDSGTGGTTLPVPSSTGSPANSAG